MTKKSVIKIWILMAIIVMISFSDWTFAADGDTESMKTVAGLLDIIVGIFSWIWVWFAKWAWEFLTNKRVYGEVLWLDTILWKWRNIMKNMANFWLWFYFVYLILKELIGNMTGWLAGSSTTKTIKDQILWILIAWIWIQASRFMTAVVIDISTITLVAAGSLPSQVVSEYPELEKDFTFAINDYLEIPTDDGRSLWDIARGVNYSLFHPNEETKSFVTEIRNVPLDRKITRKELFDEIMPNADDVSGPLYYLWFVILNSTRIISVDSSNENSLKATIFTALLQWWTTIIYSIEMLILFIFVVFRVAYMWMFIVLSPLAVLIRCVSKSSKGKSWDKWFWSKITTNANINFNSFFLNAFKPTIIVLWFSLAIIFVTLIKGVILSSAQRTIDIWWVTMSSYEDSDSITWDRGDKKYRSVIDSNVMGINIRNAWKTLLEFILSIITVILVYHIIKIATVMGTRWSKDEDFASRYLNKLQNTVGDFITHTPIIPATKYDENWNRVDYYYDKNWNKKRVKVSLAGLANIPRDKYNDKMREYGGKDSKAVDSFMKLIWLQNDNSLSNVEKDGIISAWAHARWLDILKEKRDYIKGISNKGWKWMVLDPNASDKFWQNKFSDWMDDVNIGEINDRDWYNMVSRWKDNKNNGRTLAKMFRQNDSGLERSITAYATLFWLQWNISTWEELMRKDISNTDHTWQKKQWEESGESSN